MTTSTSTRDATLDPKGSGASRLAVRLRNRAQTLTAWQVDKEQIVETIERTLRAFPQDWIIAAGEKPIDVVTAKQFESLYEPIEKRGLILTAEDQTALAKTLGFGSTNSSHDLTLAVQRLARLKIGGVDVDFSPAQWEELTHRAQKRGLSLTVYLDRMVEKLLQDLWTSA